MEKPVGNSCVLCRTCGGKKVIKIQAHTSGKAVEAKQATCPACRGSGKAGYVTK